MIVRLKNWRDWWEPTIKWQVCEEKRAIFLESCINFNEISFILSSNFRTGKKTKEKRNDQGGKKWKENSSSFLISVFMRLPQGVGSWGGNFVQQTPGQVKMLMLQIRELPSTISLSFVLSTIPLTAADDKHKIIDTKAKFV